ncbi:MAG: class II histone deacetylase, partial [Burkholderiales bacterium]|nr:class II histone deacetylase [Burkholderiales bacterium]
VEKIRRLSADAGGDAGELTPFGKGSWEIACLSAGGCIALLDAVWSGRVRNGYSLNRPPGHHADADLGRGYCIFGNAVVAIRNLQARCGVARVAVVDWDVHHGNGTQGGFYEDPSVLTISLHQDGNYPAESGSTEENGRGAGIGSNLNVPLPAGSGTGAYLSAFERVVLPALERFRPEILVVLSGFDACNMDPLGRMMLHSNSYRQLTRLLMDAAERLCGGRLAMFHEGGYSPVYVPFCGVAVLEELSGRRSPVVDPFLPFWENLPGQRLQAHQEAAITRAARLVEAVPVPA